MAKFNQGILLDVNVRHMTTTTYGATDNRFSDNDRNKAVKLGASGTMVLCAEGDEIEGFVEALEPATVDGLSHGTCTTYGPNVRWWVQGENLAIGDYVVCGQQTDPTTKNNNDNHPLNQFGTTVVKKGNPTIFRWRVIARDPRNRDVFLISAI